MELPELYAGASPLQKRDAVQVLTQYLPRFEWDDDDIVLDFGCGDGELTRCLAGSIPRSAFIFLFKKIII